MPNCAAPRIRSWPESVRTNAAPAIATVLDDAGAPVARSIRDKTLLRVKHPDKFVGRTPTNRPPAAWIARVTTSGRFWTATVRSSENCWPEHPANSRPHGQTGSTRNGVVGGDRRTMVSIWASLQFAAVIHRRIGPRVVFRIGRQSTVLALAATLAGLELLTASLPGQRPAIWSINV